MIQRCAVGLACGVLLVLASSSPLLAQRSSGERRAEAPVPELIPRLLGTPDVAFSDGKYLVVWIDQRLGGGAQPINQLLGARVTDDGRVLDPRGFAIASSAALRREPRVVASADGFVVLWRESRRFGSDLARFARVTADGQVLDPDGSPLPLFDAQALACTDFRCLAISSPVNALRTLGFDVCGVAGAEQELMIPARTSSQSAPTVTPPRIAGDACGYWLAFGQHDEQSREMSIALFGFEPDGELRFGTTLLRLPPGTVVPPTLDLAPNAKGELLLVWQQQLVSSSPTTGVSEATELWSQRVDRGGEPSSDARRLMAGTSPALAFTGAEYVLISGAETLTAQRLDAAGELLAQEPVVIRAQPQGVRGPARVAAGPDGALVVWQPTSTTIASEHNVARLDREGQLLDPDGLAVAASTNRQRAPALARDGEGYRLLFHDDRPDRPGLLGLQLDAQARPLDASTLVLQGTFAAGREPQLRAAADRPALIWSEGDVQLLSWLDPATYRASEPIALAAGPAQPRSPGLFVPGDDSILALGQHPGQLCGEDQECDVALSLQLLGLDGNADPARPAVMLGPDGEFARTGPIAEYDGRGFVVAFTQTRVAFGERVSGLRAVHVEPDGSIAGEPHVVSDTPTGGFDEAVALAPAVDGGLLLLTRVDGSSALPRNQMLYGVRLGADASAIDPEPFAIATAPAERSGIRAVWDGEAWLVVWEERVEDGSWDVRGARVPFESSAEVAAFGVAVSPLDELAPALAALGPNRALVAYERFDSDPEAMTGRVFLRDLHSAERCADPACCDGECATPSPPACELPSQSAQVCADGTPERTARYGCGCAVIGGPRSGVGAALLVALLSIRRTRRQTQRFLRNQRKSENDTSTSAAHTPG